MTDETDDPRRAALRAMTDAMLTFAAELSGKTGGVLSQLDVARLLIGTGATLLSEQLGRATAVNELRALAAAIEAGAGTKPQELN